MELLVRQARIWEREGLWDVGVAGGRYAEIAPRLDARGAQELEAEGRLLAPAFIDPHIHLDKVLTAGSLRPNRSGTLREAIEILWESKANSTVEEIARRAGQVIESAVLTGTTRLRTHVDVDTIGKLRPLEGLLAARERYRDLVDLEIVAFPQEGIVRDPGTEALMW